MVQVYNPFVRAFCQLRAELVEGFGLPRRQVRPEAPLEAIIPLENRREIWRRLWEKGIRVPNLELSPRARLLSVLLVLTLAAAFALWLQAWPALLVAIPTGLCVGWTNRRWAVHFPRGLHTVGDLTLYLTSFGDHSSTDFWCTSEGISIRVRFVIAESLNIDFLDVRPESTLRELGAE
jgi:hypothetical protein